MTLNKDRPPPYFSLTKHATAVLAEREIDVLWIEQILREPEVIEHDRIDPALRHALGHIAERE